MAFHVNNEGNVGRCQAEKQCPFGDLVKEHYATEKDARQAYEYRMAKENPVLGPHRRINLGDLAGTETDDNFKPLRPNNIDEFTQAVSYRLYYNGLALTRENVRNTLANEGEEVADEIYARLEKAKREKEKSVSQEQLWASLRSYENEIYELSDNSSLAAAMTRLAAADKVLQVWSKSTEFPDQERRLRRDRAQYRYEVHSKKLAALTTGLRVRLKPTEEMRYHRQEAARAKKSWRELDEQVRTQTGRIQ